MAKKVDFGSKPSKRNQDKQQDAWVTGETANKEKMKRLTIDIPESLHRQIKADCAMRGVKIADEIRQLLNEKYKKE